MMRLGGDIPGLSEHFVPHSVPDIACYQPHSYLQHAGISLNFKA